ncbi:MAG: hypothetical protein DRN49_01285 [Thaumarchaeota archaeon]|nr:MAG: hypothetical protein DRN49_01285 [Nitrososphaerota archaeon]
MVLCRNCPIYDICDKVRADYGLFMVDCGVDSFEKCVVYRKFLKYLKLGFSRDEAAKIAVEEDVEELFRENEEEEEEASWETW